MLDTFLLGFVQNVAILLSFSMLYDYLWEGKENRNEFRYQLIAGIFLGSLSILLILTPWTFMPGVFFDTRSVLLSVSGLFFGFIPTTIAMICAAAYRIYVDGSGAGMGVAVIFSSGLVGILWAKIRPQWRKSYIKDLLLLGLTVHILMILCTVFLPTDLIFTTAKRILIPVLVFYPVATLLLGLLMKHQSETWNLRKALDNSERRWRFALEGAGDGLWDWDVPTNKLFFSTQWKRMLGFNDNEIGDDLSDWENLVHPDDLQSVYAEINKLIEGKIEDYATEYRMLSKNGSIVWILDRGKAITRDNNGKAVRCIGTHKNITSIKQNEFELKQITEYTNSILQTIPSLIFIMDKNGNFLESKSGNENDFYMPVESFINKNFREVLPPAVAEKIQQSFQQVYETNSIQTFEYELNIPSGLRSFECMAVPFMDNKIITVINDITQRVQFEESLKESKTKLKDFASHLQIVREEERQFLAKEIHDQLGQILIAMKIDMGLLGIKLNRLNFQEDYIQTNIPEYERLNTFIEKALNTTRKIMSELHSEVLDILGLEEAIRFQLNKLSEAHQVHIDFKSNINEIFLSKERSIPLYRIFIEAVNNALSHSKASEIKVNLTCKNGFIKLNIEDNGVGFDYQKVQQEKSFGLLSMYERALFLDGELYVESQIGVGTKISLTVPEMLN